MDYSSYCNICYNVKINIGEPTKDILNAIEDIFRIKICNDEFSNLFQICASCASKVKDFHNFFMDTRINLRRYRECMQTKLESVKKEEESTETECETVQNSILIDPKLIVEIKRETPVFVHDLSNTKSEDDESDDKDKFSDIEISNDNKCDCGRTYKSRISFLQHRRKNLRECNQTSEHTCCICSKKYFSVKTLNQHIKKSHSSSTVKQYLFPGIWTCDICLRTFETRNGIKKHIEEKHLKIHETICSQCGISINFYDLAKHMNLKHNKDRKRDKCEICNKFFLDLKAHSRRNHLNEGVFTCAVCGLTFNNRLKLSVHHWRKHPPPGKFKCKECGKECRNSLKLKEHMQAAHIGGFLYSCEWCDYRGNHKKNIQTHWKKYHNDLYEAKKAKMRAVYDTPDV